MTRVLVFGVFDLLHPGHLYFLKQAKRHGDHLTVVVTCDARVAHEKGAKPFFKEKERVELVKSLKDVDKVILGDKPGAWNILRKLKPDIIALGYDQKHHIKNIKKNLFRIAYIKSWKPTRYNSSKVKALHSSF